MTRRPTRRKNGQFSDAGDVLNFEVGGPAKIAADVSEDGESACRDHVSADGQAVRPSVRFTAFEGTHDDDGIGQKETAQTPAAINGRQKSTGSAKSESPGPAEVFQERKNEPEVE